MDALIRGSQKARARRKIGRSVWHAFATFGICRSIGVLFERRVRFVERRDKSFGRMPVSTPRGENWVTQFWYKAFNTHFSGSPRDVCLRARDLLVCISRLIIAPDCLLLLFTLWSCRLSEEALRWPIRPLCYFDVGVLVSSFWSRLSCCRDRCLPLFLSFRYH